MLYATGLVEEDMNKAQVGISSVWFSGNPCNMHLLQLNDKVKEGVQNAGQEVPCTNITRTIANGDVQV